MTAPMPQYLDDRIAHWAEATPDDACMTYLDRTWTWSEWFGRVRRATGGLRDLGIGHGDIVAFLDKNHPACVEFGFAAARLGAANAVINWRLAGDEVDFALNDCRAKVLVVGSELMPVVEGVRDRLTHVETVIEITPDGADGDAYEAWLAASPEADRDPSVTTDDTCLVMYSSGTTGHPKGVMLTHRNMVSHTINAHDGWEFEPGDKNLVAMPLFHVGGSSYVLFGLHDGIPSVMTREPDGVSLAGAILQGANRMFLVPAVLAQVLQAGPDAIKVFGLLKTFTYGAAPMPPPLLRQAMETWPDCGFMQVYGLTEVAGVATHLLAEDHVEAVESGHPERLLSAGRAIPGVELQVVDPATGDEVTPGQPGEILLRGDQVMPGFLGRPDDTAAAITPDGWFRTGDLGRVDDDGFVYVEDRIKDMIISGGENIYSPEVERVLAEYPGVLECAVIGAPDDKWGERVVAYVSLSPENGADASDIIEFCRKHLAHYKCPTDVQFVPALPRNPTGKILKRELRESVRD